MQKFKVTKGKLLERLHNFIPEISLHQLADDLADNIELEIVIKEAIDDILVKIVEGEAVEECLHCKGKGCEKCVGGCMECDKQPIELISLGTDIPRERTEMLIQNKLNEHTRAINDLNK